MFGIKTQQEKDLQDYVNKLEGQRESLSRGYELKIKDLESEHGLELKEKEFELKHFKDEKVREAREEVAKVSKEFAVLKKENEMLKSITDVNADIIDVKDLMNKLVEKLPSIDLKSLTIQNTSKE